MYFKQYSGLHLFTFRQFVICFDFKKTVKSISLEKGKIMNSVSSVRSNSPSFGMAAKLNQEVLDTIKHIPGNRLSKAHREIKSLHDLSNAADCDVVFTTKQLVKNIPQGKGKKPLTKTTTKILATVESRADSEIKGKTLDVNLKKLGSFFNGFFGKIDKSISEVSNKQNDIDKLKKYIK